MGKIIAVLIGVIVVGALGYIGLSTVGSIWLTTLPQTITTQTITLSMEQNSSPLALTTLPKTITKTKTTTLSMEQNSSPQGLTTLPQTKSTTETTTLAMEQKNIARKKILKKYCKNLRKTTPLKELISLWTKRGVDFRPRMFFSDTVKLILCETPKCGTTQWRNLMLILDGHLKGYESPSTDLFPLSFKHNFIWTKFDLSKVNDTAAVTKRLQNYYKIMTTREPLERLVSAYRDKLETATNPHYGPISVTIHMTVSKDSRKVREPATFEEFIDYILLNKRRGGLDPHWKPYSELCDPCSVDYDYIARMETVYDDAAYITSQIGVERDRIYNSDGYKDIHEKRNSLFYEYFEKIPSSKRYAIFKYYKDQYDMFGYEYPIFINKTLIT